MPLAQRVDAGRRRCGPADHGVDPRRGVPHRLRRQSALRGHDVGGPGRRGGDHHQLPPRPARVPRPPRPRRRRWRPLCELGPARLRRGPAMGAGAWRGVRRRPGRRDDLRRVGRRGCRRPLVRHADGTRPVPQGGGAERCAAHVPHGACRRAGRASDRARRRVERGRAALAARRADPRRAAAGGGRRRRPHVHPGGRRNGGADPAGPCAPRRVRGRGPHADRVERGRVEAVGRRRPAQPRPRRGPAAFAARSVLPRRRPGGSDRIRP